jgi:hypothetical protein
LLLDGRKRGTLWPWSELRLAVRGNVCLNNLRVDYLGIVGVCRFVVIRS